MDLESAGLSSMLAAVIAIGSPLSYPSPKTIPLVALAGPYDGVNYSGVINLTGISIDNAYGHLLYFNKANINTTYKAVTAYLGPLLN
ncbi:hypothetical protein Back11_08180 [Paenibacillus baekrokdamisoli]|uniref:Uncharacterized protein n=1 Tax=Paenibacillus baekrokdamisoli TaxID=1712516 RepID=A0A3G9J430_9BACL|nr:hypothetical protein [Paenibacillus baekrokdamisoli]MBB3067341.1 hypothetical protein [Paenibacillus baekrokdamisoli]BBH19473.1 hypothetical protein Back11_08180 [Paenibacillus baekrokdamisoli]